MAGADATGGDFGFEIVFPFDRGSGETAEHGDLADMSQSVGNRTLEDAFNGCVEFLGRGEEIVKLLKGGEKAFNLGIPGQGRGIVPGLIALRDGKRPVKEIADVREDLRGRSSFVPDVEAGEMFRGAAQGFAAAIGNGGDGVTKKLAGGIR